MFTRDPFDLYRSRSRALGAALVAAALVLSLASGARAETKTYPGSFCVPQDNAQAQYVTAASGQIKVTVATSLVCPIVKSVSSDPKIDSVTLNISAAGASGAPTCDLWAMNAAVTASGTSNMRFHMAGVVAADRKTITFPAMGGGVNPPPNPFTDFFYYQINCSMRANDKIYDYVVNEAGSNTNSYKIYPPSMCRPDYFFNSSPFVHVTPSMGNSPGGYMQTKPGPNNLGLFTILCPVINDHVTTNAAGTTVAQIALGRPDVVNTKITCTMYAADSLSGNPIDSKSAFYDGAASSFPLKNFNIDVHNSVKGARYHIYCESPSAGDAKINGYKIQEAP